MNDLAASGGESHPEEIEECRESLAAAIRLIQDDRLNAESARLDQCYFNLDEELFRRFTAMLDDPPDSNPGLARLLGRKAQWEK